MWTVQIVMAERNWRAHSGIGGVVLVKQVELLVQKGRACMLIWVEVAKDV